MQRPFVPADKNRVTQVSRAPDWRARAYIVAVILVGVAVAAYSVYDLVARPVGFEWLILLALTVGSSWASLRIPGSSINFSISDIFNIAAALLFGPSAGAITAAVDGLVLSARMDKQPAVDRSRALQHGSGHDRRLGCRPGVFRDRRKPSGP